MKPYYKKRGILEAKKSTDKSLTSSKKSHSKIRIYRGGKKAFRREIKHNSNRLQRGTNTLTTMKVNLINLQRQTIKAYNRLIENMNMNTEDDIITLKKDNIDEILTDLHNCLAAVGSLMDEEGKSYLDDKYAFIDTLDVD